MITKKIEIDTPEIQTVRGSSLSREMIIGYIGNVQGEVLFFLVIPRKLLSIEILRHDKEYIPLTVLP